MDFQKEIMTTQVPDEFKEKMNCHKDELSLKNVLHRIKIRLKYIAIGKKINWIVEGRWYYDWYKN